jgi:hypothetical protein
MQLKKNSNVWDVWQACRVLGYVKKVPQNPAYGRGSGPVSGDVMVWGAFTIDDRRVGMDFRTRQKAAEALVAAQERIAQQA